MPFGIQCSNHQVNKKLYPKAFKEIERVIKPNGKVVLLTAEKKLAHYNLTVRKTWNIEKSYTINMNGLPAQVFVLTRRINQEIES